tara:strand:+ start:3151 stop:5514 length:2364 start_codon:yes stop_codon:yes gene_type:complete
MNDLLNFLFGLGASGDGQSLGFGTPDAQLVFVHAIPSWAIVLVIILLASVSVWSYRAIPGGKAVRAMLAFSRAVVLGILLLLALGPRIEQTIIETEPDWVLVLLDRSGSLEIPDAPGASVTREEQLRSMLASASDEWGRLGEDKRVLWIGFDDQRRTLSEDPRLDPETLESPSGQGTDIDAAIRDALRRVAARPISAIVLVSDGRSTRPIDPELIESLADRQIPIISVPLGDADPIRDLAIERVEHPDAVFAKDLAPIRVHLSGRGMREEDLTRDPIFVELVDHERNEVLDRVPVTPDQLGLGTDEAAPITLMHTPVGDGERRLDLRIVSDGAVLDLNAGNDAQSISMRVVERPLRVLYIDGYPRWEHRYLKFMLLREPSIVSSSMLLSATRRYIQEGDELIASLPGTLEEWEPFDVIILGDVRAELFSSQQLETLREHILTRGAGLLWIAGPSAVPDAYLGTPLSSLLPMRSDAGGSQSVSQAWGEPVTMRATPEATRLGVLRLSDDGDGWLERLSSPDTGWSKLQWAQALDPSSFKPGVSVLAHARAVDSGEQAPIMTMMRYGAGVSAYVATDEIWRWRYGRGEDLPERFWLPIVRALGRGTVARRAAPAQLVVTPSEPGVAQATQITLRVFDQQRIEALPERVRVRIGSLADRGEPVEIELAGVGDTRTGVWVPGRPGNFEIRPLGLDADMVAISQRTRVFDHADERRTLDADHTTLVHLATETDGWVAEPDSFAAIPDQLPNRARTLVTPPRRASLWDRPIVLIVLISLLTFEWIGRRALRLA